MSRLLPIFTVAAILLSLTACTDPLDPTPSTAFQQEWPMPMNRTGYVVSEISYYLDENNHIEAAYNYDENYRLVSIVTHDTYEDYYGVHTTVLIDSFYYQGGRLQKIASLTESSNPCNYDILFYYDNEGRPIKVTYGNNEICYAYHNGMIDSIYSPGYPMGYTHLDYDAQGNVIRDCSPYPITDNWGELTGEYEIRTTEYTYDNHPRPNFNLDNAFVFEPIFGMGSTYPSYVRNLSPNNMTSLKFSYSQTVGETWHYGYNQQGLPVTMYHHYAGSTSTGAAYRFTYRHVK